MNDTPRTDVHAFDWTAIARREAPANSAYVVAKGGMMDDEKKTLRDEFAMAALSGLIARAYSESDWEKLPIICYKLADAMLKARKV